MLKNTLNHANDLIGKVIYFVYLHYFFQFYHKKNPFGMSLANTSFGCRSVLAASFRFRFNRALNIYLPCTQKPKTCRHSEKANEICLP